MLLQCSTEENNVIQVDDTPIQVQLTNAGFHQPLKCCWGIGEPEGHTFTFQKPSGPMVKCSQGFGFLL